ncbi:MAG: RNA polymerase sigma factor [Bacteroidota bacterium]|nr:RNA polymerase sigma factor [Bacteroidota bacterium]
MTAIEFNQQLINQRVPLKNFAYSLTMSSEEAQDLVQETYLKALKYREKFADATNLRAWLYTIMKNTFINTYRRSVKTRQIITQTEDLSYVKPAAGSYGPGAESLMNVKYITNAIEALDEDYKIPFVRYNDGYKYKEIADELNLPIGTVKSRIFLARKRLMDQLKEAGFKN